MDRNKIVRMSEQGPGNIAEHSDRMAESSKQESREMERSDESRNPDTVQ